LKKHPQILDALQTHPQVTPEDTVYQLNAINLCHRMNMSRNFGEDV
jgi:hypothetical protein